jgi:LPXTG-motif cell wall-anchored protein
MNKRFSARLGLAALITPAVAVPAVTAAPVQATGLDSDVSSAAADVDLGTLQSCTAVFGLSKQNSRTVSFDVKGPLASSIEIGENLVPVYEYVDTDTSQTAHCRMEIGWDPTVPLWSVTDASQVDLTDDTWDDDPDQFAENFVEGFFLFGIPAPIALELDRLMVGGSRAQFLLPMNGAGTQPASPTPPSPESIMLVPADSSVSAETISYDPAVPESTTIMTGTSDVLIFFGGDPQPDYLEAIFDSMDALFARLLPSLSEPLQSELDSILENLRAGGGCINFSPDLFTAVREAFANSVFWEAAVDAGVEDELELGDIGCDLLLFAFFAASIDLVADSRVIEVTAGTLPATGFGSTEVIIAAFFALATGGALAATRRRRLL